MRFLFFCILLAAALCLRPSMKNALRNKVVTDFKDAIVPIIYKQISHIVVPDVHTEHSGFKIDVTSIYIDIAAFHPSQIGIVFVPNTSIIRFAGANFAMKGGAHIHAKWHFISKSMGADVTVSHLGFGAEIALLSNAGKPNIKVNHATIGLSSHDVGIHIHGDIISKIIEFVADLLKGHFVKTIVSQLESKIPPMMTNEVNKRLNTLPTDIPIGEGLVMKYSFSYSPFVKADYLYTGIAAYIHPKNNPNPPPYDAEDIPEFDAANPKGIQFFISDYIVKSALYASFSIGLMTVSFEKDLLGHHIKMTCKASKVPDFGFKNSIDATLDATCLVDFDNKPENRFTLLASLHVNLEEHVKQAVIFFSIKEAKILQLEYKQEHPVDIQWFKNGINTILQVIIQIVNGDLGQKGIPLPVIHGIDYTDIVQFIKMGYMEVATTPVFHFTMDEEA